MRFRRFAMLLLACAVSRSQRARAEGDRFDWQGPDCSTSASLFQRRLQELVGEADLQRLAGRVGVVRQGKPWIVVVAIELDGEHLGERRFEAASCEHAAETAAVAASMVVFDSGPPPQAAAANHIGPDIWTRRAAAAPSAAPARSSSPPSGSVEPRAGVLGVAEVGSLPRPVLGAGVEAELAFAERYSAALVGSVTGEQQRSAGPGRSAGLRVFAATARACVAPWGGPVFRIDGCAGLRFMTVHGQGDGFDVNRAASLSWAAPLLGINLSLRAPRFLEWRVELDASSPLSRRRFLVDGEQISRPGLLVLGMRLGPVLRFQ